MTSDGDALAAFGLGGLVGYLLEKGKISGWEDFIKAYDTRVDHLSYFKVVMPYAFGAKSEEFKMLYREGVYAYLFGLPNASVPTMLHCLEIALKDKLKEVEMKDNPQEWGLYKLIEWGEKYLKDKKDVAHGFRILRNLIHERKVIKEKDALECINHVSEVINLLYDFDLVMLSVPCSQCKIRYSISINKDQYYLGAMVSIQCPKCVKNSSYRLIQIL